MKDCLGDVHNIKRVAGFSALVYLYRYPKILLAKLKRLSATKCLLRLGVNPLWQNCVKTKKTIITIQDALSLARDFIPSKSRQKGQPSYTAMASVSTTKFLILS